MRKNLISHFDTSKRAPWNWSRNRNLRAKHARNNNFLTAHIKTARLPHTINLLSKKTKNLMSRWWVRELNGKHTHTHTHIRYYKRNKKNRLEAENRAITKFWVEKRATRRGTFQTFENVSMWQKCWFIVRTDYAQGYVGIRNIADLMVELFVC